ncbi:MAG TPA: phage holin family protein [Stackebrandtia sp.]|uniref:phage holin family protein n=1 Tax=Stackebrandtia sp. TaxID=2023065 RepID=UPI002D2ABFF6|nr:phage holin family protein [Stackebrandtia sp.]HZE40611.1 phage holin family protein [Stackebrandtia sp.]
MRHILKIAVTAVALWVTTLLFHDIQVNADTTAGKIGTIVLIALIFGLVNAIIKPIVKGILKVGCVYYLSLGLLGLVLNAVLFLLVLFVADKLNIPFAIKGDGLHQFWIAFLAAIVITVVSWVLHLVIPDKYDEKQKN